VAKLHPYIPIFLHTLFILLHFSCLEPAPDQIRGVFRGSILGFGAENANFPPNSVKLLKDAASKLENFVFFVVKFH
jgi:hypothetical protein